MIDLIKQKIRAKSPGLIRYPRQDINYGRGCPPQDIPEYEIFHRIVTTDRYPGHVLYAHEESLEKDEYLSNDVRIT